MTYSPRNTAPRPFGNAPRIDSGALLPHAQCDSIPKHHSPLSRPAIIAPFCAATMPRAVFLPLPRYKVINPASHNALRRTIHTPRDGYPVQFPAYLRAIPGLSHSWSISPRSPGDCRPGSPAFPHPPRSWSKFPPPLYPKWGSRLSRHLETQSRPPEGGMDQADFAIPTRPVMYQL